MKKNIVFALLASAIFLAGLTGCVSQKEHEGGGAGSGAGI